MVNNNKFSRSN